MCARTASSCLQLKGIETSVSHKISPLNFKSEAHLSSGHSLSMARAPCLQPSHKNLWQQVSPPISSSPVCSTFKDIYSKQLHICLYCAFGELPLILKFFRTNHIVKYPVISSIFKYYTIVHRNTERIGINSNQISGTI